MRGIIRVFGSLSCSGFTIVWIISSITLKKSLKIPKEHIEDINVEENRRSKEIQYNDQKKKGKGKITMINNNYMYAVNIEQHKIQ